MKNDTFLRETDVKKVLKELHLSFTKEYIPVITVMLTLGIIGVMGNAVTVVFYGFKTEQRSSTTVFIGILAFIDLFASLCVFVTVAELFVNIYFSNLLACKVMDFLIGSIVHTSLTMIWIISIDRYLKICKPFGVQFSRRSAKISSVILFVCAVVFQAKAFVVTEVVTRSVKVGNITVNVYECSFTDKPNLENVVTIYHALSIGILLFVLGTVIFTYGSIRKCLKQINLAASVNKSAMRMIKTEKNHPKNDTDPYRIDRREKEDNFEAEKQTASNDSKETQPVPLDESSANGSDKNLMSISFIELRQKSAYSQTERNITVMLLVVSVGLFLCVAPSVLCSIYLAVQPKGSEAALTVWAQLILRSPYLNNVINPFVFFIFNPQYRNYITEILKCCNRRMDVEIY